VSACPVCGGPVAVGYSGMVRCPNCTPSSYAREVAGATSVEDAGGVFSAGHRAPTAPRSRG